MSFATLFFLAIGLSMDAFAVSICKGLAMQKINIWNIAVVGLWFGGFQGLMPVIGYALGINFKAAISSIDHWIAFVLLVLIGLNMVREALSGEQVKTDASLRAGGMFVLAVATSIDALAVGVTFAFLSVHIIPAALFIAVTTCVLSMAGVKAGNVFGAKYKEKAELAGGMILVFLGIKILLEHLGVI